MDLFNLNQISVQDMLLVKAISETTSVSRAALTMGISQPTASYRLNKLRDIFSDQIFVSINRKMMPTPKGFQIVKTMTGQVDNFVRLISTEDFDPLRTRREFIILARGFQISALLKMVPPVFFRETRLAKLFIEAEKDVATTNRDLLERADFFATPFEHQGAKGIRRLVSPAVKVMLYYDPGIRNAPETIEEFANRRFVLLESLKNTRSFVDEHLQANGFGARNIVSYAPTSGSISGFIGGTDLVYVGTSYNTTEGFNNLSIANLPFEVPSIRHEIRWSIAKENDKGHRWLRQIITESSRQALKPAYRIDPTEDFFILSEFEKIKDVKKAG